MTVQLALMSKTVKRRLEPVLGQKPSRLFACQGSWRVLNVIMARTVKCSRKKPHICESTVYLSMID